MHNTTLAVAMTALTIPLAAQGSFISPAAAATAEGNSNNNFPWTNTFHYQQMHGDVRGSARIVKGHAHRRDGLSTTVSLPRTFDVEIWAGEGTFNASTISATFANNYAAAPTQVFTRKMVNAPDWSTRPTTPPAPFDFTFTYDTPFAYSGSLDLVWEMAIHATTATSSYVADAQSQGSVSSPTTILGTGCVATGRTTAMSHTATYTNNPNTNQLLVTLSVSNGTPSSQGVFLMGATNPALPLPGFCGTSPTLFTSGELQLPGTTSSTGAMSTGALPIRWNNAFTGAQLYTQAATIDAGLPGGLAISNGRSVQIVAMPAPGLYARIYASGQPTATSGTVGLAFALVCEFST